MGLKKTLKELLNYYDNGRIDNQLIFFNENN